jgi:hypothetical protein
MVLIGAEELAELKHGVAEIRTQLGALARQLSTAKAKTEWFSVRKACAEYDIGREQLIEMIMTGQLKASQRKRRGGRMGWVMTREALDAALSPK